MFSRKNNACYDGYCFSCHGWLRHSGERMDPVDHWVNDENNSKDSIESVKAFMKVYKVLMSPRCMNCHPAGDAPLQGDDSHVHTMNVQRGKDGKGCMQQNVPTAISQQCARIAYTSG